jgi:sulfate adenylyltransferase subunit 1 (EFTu-like GTPase family)
MMPPVASTSPDARADEPPAATFLVRGIFILGMRSLFIVRGTVASGTVRAKQRVIGLPGMDAEVQSVEARLLDVSGGASQTALTFHYTKQAQLERWKSLVVEGSLLSLAAPG